MYADNARFESLLHERMTKKLEMKPQPNTPDYATNLTGAKNVAKAEREMTDVQTD